MSTKTFTVKMNEAVIKSGIALGNVLDSTAGYVEKHKDWFYIGGLAVAVCMIANTADAVTVDNLKKPIQDLKQEVFGSWMMVAKIAAGAVGAGFAIAKQSLSPFGIGAGISVGIHFYDTYIGDGSGALL